LKIPKTVVEKFYRLTLNRSFAEAERLLEKLSLNLRKNEWGKGYLTALAGILAAARSKDDKYVFMNRIPREKRKLHEIVEEFKHRVESPVSSEFDKGFFSAWFLLVKFLINGKIKLNRLNEARSPQNHSVKENPESKP
jgi:hypothetical protein